MATPTHLHIVYGCFHATMAHLSSCGSLGLQRQIYLLSRPIHKVYNLGYSSTNFDQFNSHVTTTTIKILKISIALKN